MDALLEAFSSLGVESSVIASDVRVIIDCYLCERSSIDTSRLSVQQGDFANSIELYAEVLRLLAGLQKTQHLLELMPYIDDYLEYYDSLCAL